METLRLKRVLYRPRFELKLRPKKIFAAVYYVFFVAPNLKRELEPGRFEEIKRLEYPVKL
ncbi:MAG: hypothetical protein CME65_14835 [Halobacteriovoraceae bacterium]|nr:hypothetical protein [Halobacteriovoraceae bacterium]